MTNDGGVALIHALGPLRVDIDGHATVPTGKTATLLALLVVHRGRYVSDEQLIDELWSTAPPAAADSAFRTYLAAVRTLLGKHRIETSRAGFRLDRSLVAVDLDAVAVRYRMCRGESAVAREAILREVNEELRQGAFVGVDHQVGPIADEVRVLGELRDAVYLDWLRARLDAGEGATLIGDLRRAGLDDREHEGRTRLLMEALVRFGDRRGALRAFGELEVVLRESGLRPGPELAAYELSIVTGADHVSTATPTLRLSPDADATTAGFFGREVHLEQLSERGRPLATVVGETGSGKTALAVRLARVLAESGVQVAYGTCTSPDEPFSALRSALPDVLAGCADDEAEVADSIREWADRGGTTCLIVDDYDRSDRGTRAVVERLSRGAPATGMLLRLFLRQNQDMLPKGTVVPLGPLTHDEVSGVLRVRLGERPNPVDVDVVERISGGNANIVAALTDYVYFGGSLSDATA